VCSLTGRLCVENQQFSLARSREDPDVRVAGSFLCNQHVSGHDTEESMFNNEPESASVYVINHSHKYDKEYLMGLLKTGTAPVEVIRIAKNRTTWRSMAEKIYEEQVMTSHYVSYQERSIKDAHKSFMENAHRYVHRCAAQGIHYDITHILFMFNQYEKPAYRGVYFTQNVDAVKLALKENVINTMLDVWEKLSRAPGVKRDNFTFQTCARGILVIMAGHSVDHEHGLRVQLKVDRETGEPSRITEYDGVQSVDMKKYEIREFNFIPRVEGLVLAPASIVNQEKSNRKRTAGTKRGSSSRLIVSSNTRSKKGNGALRRSTGSNRNEGRMPSVKNVHSIVSEIIENAKTSSSIEQFSYV